MQRFLLPSGQRTRIVALAVVVDHPAGHLHVVATCIDWELEFAAQRRAQTRVLAQLLTDPSRDGPLPVFLTADLNAPPTTPEAFVAGEARGDVHASDHYAVVTDLRV